MALCHAEKFDYTASNTIKKKKNNCAYSLEKEGKNGLNNW